MKKKRIHKLFAIAIVLVSCITLTACEQSVSEFSGSSTGNSRQFLLDFDVLNSTQSNHIELQNGDRINTTIAIKKGKVDILVKNQNGTVIYQGNDVESSTFTIEITEPGDYMFSVTGRKAKGSVHFIKEEPKA